MRLGILLILLQSMLLCAEGRTEPAAVELDSASTQVGVLLTECDTAEPEEPDPQYVTGERYTFQAATTAAIAQSTPELPISIARTAHTIRGPPARQ